VGVVILPQRLHRGPVMLAYRYPHAGRTWWIWMSDELNGIWTLSCGNTPVTESTDPDDLTVALAAEVPGAPNHLEQWPRVEIPAPGRTPRPSATPPPKYRGGEGPPADGSGFGGRWGTTA
jgi:hypothetical protein